MSFVRPTSSFRPSRRSFVRLRLWYVLDRQILNGWSHHHQNRRLCSRLYSNESVIFWDSYFSSYGEFGEFSLIFTAAVSAVAVFTKKAAQFTLY